MDDRLRAYLRVAERSDEEFVDDAFALILRRGPDADSRARALAKLADGTLSRATLLHELACAPEVGRIRVLDDAIALATAARGRGERQRLLKGPPATDERVIEIPWVLSRLRPGAVLEVGYAFAEPSYLAALVGAGCDRLAGVDLASSEAPGMETVVADVRTLPFPDRTFEQVLLVSTLEHIGADNAVYGYAEGRDDGSGRLAALRELRRTLIRGGSLLVTVPLGEPGDYGWFRQEDVRGWSRLFARAGLFIEEQEVYELTDDGWRAAPTFRAKGVRYGDRGPAASAVLCADLSPNRLGRLVSPSGWKRAARRKAAPYWRRLRPIESDDAPEDGSGSAA
jgi:SAM-dependent methyltransferase